jgi:hypothetical protein
VDRSRQCHATRGVHCELSLKTDAREAAVAGKFEITTDKAALIAP